MSAAVHFIRVFYSSVDAASHLGRETAAAVAAAAAAAAAAVAAAAAAVSSAGTRRRIYCSWRCVLLK